MNTEKFLNSLFPNGSECHIDNNVITGYTSAGNTKVSVVGTTDSAELDPTMVLKISAHVISMLKVQF